MVSKYIYDVLVITKRDFVDNMKDIGKIIKKLTEVGLKVNVEK